MERLRRGLDECTLEKHGDGAGTRSMSRVVLMAGLIWFALLALEAQLVFVGQLAGWWAWSELSGYFQWGAAVAGGTPAAYLARIIATRKES